MCLKTYQNTPNNFPNKILLKEKKITGGTGSAILRDRQGHFEGQAGPLKLSKLTRDTKFMLYVSKWM